MNLQETVDTLIVFVNMDEESTAFIKSMLTAAWSNGYNHRMELDYDLFKGVVIQTATLGAIPIPLAGTPVKG